MPLEFDGLRLNPNLLRPARAAPCQLDVCGGACCVGGIWLDVLQVQKILDAEALVAAWLPPERRDPDGWFSDEVVEHADFPSGVGTATAVLPRLDGSGRQACVFALADHRCALECAGMQAGMPWPGLKPFDCATYPVLRSEGELRRDTESARHGADCQGPRAAPGTRAPAGPPQPPFFRVFRREVELAIGARGYAVLEEAWKRRTARKRGPTGR